MVHYSLGFTAYKRSRSALRAIAIAINASRDRRGVGDVGGRRGAGDVAISSFFLSLSLSLSLLFSKAGSHLK